jgi:hypothetical protein
MKSLLGDRQSNNSMYNLADETDFPEQKNSKYSCFNITVIVLLILILLSVLFIVGFGIYLGVKINAIEENIGKTINDIYGSTDGFIDFAKNAKTVIDTVVEYFPSKLDEIFGNTENVIVFANKTKVVIDSVCYFIPKCREMYE